MDKDNAVPSEKFLPGFGTSVRGTPAYRHYARGAQKCYKPITTRFPFLAGILVLTLALVAIVEIVLRQYPVDGDLGSLAAPNVTRRFIYEAGEGGIDVTNLAPQERDIRARVRSASAAESFVTSPLSDLSTSGTDVSTPIGASSLTTSTPVLTSGAAYTSDSTVTLNPSTAPLAYIETSTTIPEAYIPTTTTDSRPSDETSIRGDTGPSTDSPETSVSESRTDGGTFLSLSSEPKKSMHRTQTSAYIPSSDVPPPTAAPTAAPSSYIPTISSGDIPTASYIPTKQPLSVVTTITIPNDPPASTTFTTTPGAYIPTETPLSGMSSAGGLQAGGGSLSTDPGAVIPGNPTNGGSSRLAGIPTSIVTMSGVVDTSLAPVATHTSDGMAVVVFGTPSVPSLVPVSTYTSNGVALVVMGSSSATSLVPVSTYTSNGAAYVVMGTPPETSLVPVATMTSNGVAVVVLGHPTTQLTDPTASLSSDSVLVEQVTSTSGSVAYVYMTTITLNPSQLATHTVASATPHSTATTTSNQQKTSIVFTNISYFAAWYLPTMVAVGFRVLWTIVYNNARLMEPFYRLASPAGVTGKDALDNLYLSMGSIVPEPILALLSGHSYMLLVSSIAYLIELVAPLSSEFLGVDVHHGCIPDPTLASTNHPCPTRIVVRLVPARALQGLLCLIAACIIFTMFLGRRRPSGVYSDPSSIAVMASLLHHPDVLQDFKRLDSSNKEIERQVKDQTFKLAHYQAEHEGMKYGIVPTIKVISPGDGAYHSLANGGDDVNIRNHRQGLFTRHLFRTIGDISLAVLLLGIFGVTLGYYLDSKSDGFNLFFNSDTFGPRFILTFAGGIAVSQWKRLEKEIRTLKPYRHLASSKPSSPLNTILSTSTSSPYSTLPLAIARFEFFTALIAFCYILSEILVIMVVTVPFSSDEYWMAFLAGTYVTLSILSLQILSFIAMMTWWRWTTPHLDRDPDTLIGVWALLAGSGIRNAFDDLGTAGRGDLVNTVLSWGKHRRYWLGEVVSKDDGVVRTGIYCDGDNDSCSDLTREQHAQFEPLREDEEGSSPPPSPVPFSLPAVPTVPRITISPNL